MEQSPCGPDRMSEISGTQRSTLENYPMTPARRKTTSAPPAETSSAETASGGGSSAERSLGLLSLLAREGRALSLADLAAQLALPKGTAHRICTQLLAAGFL